jgi:hypothetical protein
MLTAAWNVVERHWPKQSVRDARGFGRIVHAPGPWLQPAPCPAFREAFVAGLRAGGIGGVEP